MLARYHSGRRGGLELAPVNRGWPTGVIYWSGYLAFPLSKESSMNKLLAGFVLGAFALVQLPVYAQAAKPAVAAASAGQAD